MTKRKQPEHPEPEHVRTVPVLYAPGALYGYCPKCGAPGEMRDSKSGKDRCQQKHHYPSLEAVVSSHGAIPAPAKRKRRIT